MFEVKCEQCHTKLPIYAQVFFIPLEEISTISYENQTVLIKAKSSNQQEIWFCTNIKEMLESEKKIAVGDQMILENFSKSML